MAAYFALKGTQSNPAGSEINPKKKKHEAKGSAPGLKPGDVFFGSRLGGGNSALPKITWAISPCLTPTIFFGVSGSAQKKGSVRDFFFGWFFVTLFSNFFYLRVNSVGAFSDFKIPKSGGASREPRKTGSL
jgi:hypothetical protein